MERVTKPITPDAAGFADLEAESEAEKFHMLYRLEEHWRSGENRFSAPGEKLLGAFIDDRLIGVCGINRDPFSQHPRAGRIRHLYVSEKYRRCGAGRGTPTPPAAGTRSASGCRCAGTAALRRACIPG